MNPEAFVVYVQVVQRVYVQVVQRATPLRSQRRMLFMYKLYNVPLLYVAKDGKH